jgi:hypothetical protein
MMMLYVRITLQLFGNIKISISFILYPVGFNIPYSTPMMNDSPNGLEPITVREIENDKQDVCNL